MRYICVFFLCISLSTPHFAFAETLSNEERSQLEAQLVDVQAQEALAQKDLVTAQGKSKSLTNDIALLNAKIKAEQLEIQAKNLLIRTLGNTITLKQQDISSLDSQIARNKVGIAEMFRVLQRAEDTPLTNVFLSNGSLIRLARTRADIQTLQDKVGAFSDSLANEEAIKAQEKRTLEVKKNSAVDARIAIQKAQKNLEADQAQRKTLLSISKGTEKAYTMIIAAHKKKIDAINARLFALAGGSSPIPFGKAYAYALTAQKSTGIDAAFLLAVLTQESNLGSNQGTCYLTDASTGAGKSQKSGRAFSNVMHPTRDVPPFMTITSAVGADPFHTVVSCPQSIGWGGAMGPAQFIPSTWILLSKRVSASLGLYGIANPWNPEHAFVASALYLTDLGAASGSYTAQKNAACRYYSGSSCSRSSLVASYGTSVMALAANIQTTEIDPLQSTQ